MSREQRRKIAQMLGTPSSKTGATPTLAQRRESFAQMMATMQVPEALATSETELGGRRTLRIEPTGARAGTGPEGAVLLYFHGGSHLMGSPETALSVTGHLVDRTGIPALSVDYRLAPEHPYPADQEDCLAAYRELLERGVEPGKIVLAGDSAGGALAVTTALRARDAGLPLPGGLILFSPGLDYTHSGESMTGKDGLDPFFTPAALHATGEAYRDGADPEHPYLSPAVAADFTGFPPILVQAGTHELLLSDSVRLAERAREAETDVVLDVVAEVPHVFQAFAGVLQEADDALDRAALFLVQRTR